MIKKISSLGENFFARTFLALTQKLVMNKKITKIVTANNLTRIFNITELANCFQTTGRRVTSNASSQLGVREAGIRGCIRRVEAGVGGLNQECCGGGGLEKFGVGVI